MAMTDPNTTSNTTFQTDTNKVSQVATAGLPEAAPFVDDALRKQGINPDRLSVLKVGSKYRFGVVPPWLARLLLGFGLLILDEGILRSAVEAHPAVMAGLQFLSGMIILMATCEVLVTATERLAARLHWNHYTAGTVAEILSTIPELVVIAFIIHVSPSTAFIIALITIYNNALVFSLYSYFLPKDKHGEFVMPVPITKAGTQILIGGGAMGLILGLVMLTFNSSGQTKTSFNPIDLGFVSFILLSIFVVYIYKLMTSYAAEEAEVRENLSMSAEDIRQRIDIVYENIRPSNPATIALLFFVGVVGAFFGGRQVSGFAEFMLSEAQFNPILTALILAVFAGMSEYVILWQSHRKREYGIALANAFGGITQVMFLVFPYTLVCIAVYQTAINPVHPELPLEFSVAHVLLLLFLFPTFYTLSSLLEEDHTLGILDTVIMSGIFLFLIVLLATHGGSAT
ncbi:MAG: hypothetical protein NWP69_15150 [Congregibacter sp.]|nr:hypothetical protein [Congregibacter sp.]MDP5071995.1 hypothetical protein [Congregibacter sp.]